MDKDKKKYYKFEHKRYKGPYKKSRKGPKINVDFDDSVKKFEKNAQKAADSVENRVKEDLTPFWEGFLSWLENIKSFDTFLSLFRFNITFKMTLLCPVYDSVNCHC